MQVWPPTSSKANTQEAGAVVKESGFIQVPSMAGSRAHLSILGILDSLCREPWEEGSKGSSGNVQFLSSAPGWI